MRKLAYVALAAALGLAVTPLLAGEQAAPTPAPASAPTPAPAAAKPEAKAERISGTIAKVDAATRAIELKEGERVVNLRLEEKTEIRRGKELLKLSDLKVGDKVEVEAQGTVARHITLKPAEPAKY